MYPVTLPSPNPLTPYAGLLEWEPTKQMAGTSCPNLLSISLLFRTNLPFLITTSHASCLKQKKHFNYACDISLTSCASMPTSGGRQSRDLLAMDQNPYDLHCKKAMFNGLAWHMLPSTGCATRRSRQSKELVNSSIPNSGRIRP